MLDKLEECVLRRFWYAVIALEDLADGPKPFRLPLARTSRCSSMPTENRPP